jgi:hypothetical protein
MLGTPYVSRSLRRNNFGVVSQSDKIDIGESSWDGIDKREYDKKWTLTPDEARYIATELWKLAEQIDGKSKKTSAIGAIRERVKQIAKEAKEEAYG